MHNNWRKYGIEVPTNRFSGNYKTTCPNCRDTRGNPKDKSLSCNLATGMFNCHHCGWTGCVAEEEEWEKQERQKAWLNAHPLKQQRKEYAKPKPMITKPYSDRLIAYMKSRGISEATMTAMRITEGMEFMPQHGKEMNTIQFNYYLNGELINTKFRTGDKCFKMVKDAEKTFYNIDSIRDIKDCIITEGEFDAISFYEVGLHNAISVPNGASDGLEWLQDYWDEFFADKETIYIAGDNDTAGEKMKQELIRRFGIERCKMVEYGEGCKDANDHLIKFGRESLLQCVENAKEIPVAGIFTVSDIEPQLDLLYYSGGLQRGATIGLPDFDKLCSFETKRLCIITGIPSHGKSEWLDEMVYRLNLRYGWKFAYFSPENEPLELHLAKLIEKYTGKKLGKDTMPYQEYDFAKKHIDKNIFFELPEDDFKLDSILSLAKVLVRRNGIKGLIIDPYNYLEATMERDQNETQYISSLLGKMKTFAKLNDIIIFLVAHPTKMQRNKNTGQYDPPTLYDISGSAHFYNKTDFGITVFRNFEEDFTSIHVQKVKFRHLGEKGVAMFKYNINNGRYTPMPLPGEQPQWDNTNNIVAGITEKEIEAEKKSVINFAIPTDEEEYEQQFWYSEPSDEEPPF